MSSHKSRRTRTTLASKSITMNLEKIGVSRFDFNDPYHFALTLSWAEFFIVVILADLAINAVFALIYFAVPGCIAKLPANSLLSPFKQPRP